MMRVTGLSIGAAALCAAWLTTSAQPVTAAGGPRKRVEILRGGGGSGHLGVVLEDVQADDVARLKLSDERGALVKEVEADTPAYKAGLKEGDVILRYQGQDVWSVAQLTRMVRETPPGRKVALEVSRDGATQRLSASVDDRGGPLTERVMERLGRLEIPMPEMPDVPDAPEMPEMPSPPLPPGKDHALFRDFFIDRGPRKLGIEYQEISGQLAKYFRLAADGGILVAQVNDDGPAAKAGIKAGDVILKVDGKGVKDGGDLRDALAKLDPGDDATLTVQRDGRALDLKVKIGGRRPEARRRGAES